MKFWWICGYVLVRDFLFFAFFMFFLYFYFFIFLQMKYIDLFKYLIIPLSIYNPPIPHTLSYYREKSHESGSKILCVLLNVLHLWRFVVEVSWGFRAWIRWSFDWLEFLNFLEAFKLESNRTLTALSVLYRLSGMTWQLVIG